MGSTLLFSSSIELEKAHLFLHPLQSFHIQLARNSLKQHRTPSTIARTARAFEMEIPRRRSEALTVLAPSQSMLRTLQGRYTLRITQCLIWRHQSTPIKPRSAAQESYALVWCLFDYF